MSILSERFKTHKKFLEDNQVVSLGTVGDLFTIYSAKYVKEEYPKIYKLSEYKIGFPNKVKDRIVEDKSTSIYKALTECATIWKQYISNSVKFTLLHTSLPKNNLISYGTATAGLYQLKTELIFIARNLVDNINDYKRVVLHECAHKIWYVSLNDNQRNEFKSYFENNVEKSDLKKQGIPQSDAESVFSLVNRKLKNNEMTPQNAIESISNILIELLGSENVSKNSLKDQFRKQFTSKVNEISSKYNKNAVESINILLNNKNAFIDILLKLKVPYSLNYIKKMNYMQGKAPSEYATTDFEEYWAEAVAYTMLPNDKYKVSDELKQLVTKIVSEIK